jgi:hypothetical protein
MPRSAIFTNAVCVNIRTVIKHPGTMQSPYHRAPAVDAGAALWMKEVGTNLPQQKRALVASIGQVPEETAVRLPRWQRFAPSLARRTRPSRGRIPVAIGTALMRFDAFRARPCIADTAFGVVLGEMIAGGAA